MTGQLNQKQVATDETWTKHGHGSVFHPCFIRGFYGFRILSLAFVGLSALVLGQVWISSAQAGKVKVWHHDRPEHFDKAQLKQAVVSNEGAVRLSKQLQPLVGLDAAHVWDVLEDKRGNLFVATGNEGKIFQVTPQGKVSIAYESQDT